MKKDGKKKVEEIEKGKIRKFEIKKEEVGIRR